jgi:hypothetical protein
MAIECGLSPQRVLPRVSRLAELAMQQLPEALSEVDAMPAGGDLLPLFREQIELRARSLIKGLADTAGSMQQGTAPRKRPSRPATKRT